MNTKNIQKVCFIMKIYVRFITTKKALNLVLLATCTYILFCYSQCNIIVMHSVLSITTLYTCIIEQLIPNVKCYSVVYINSHVSTISF